MPIKNFVFNLMDGSLFFRGVSALLEFVSRMCGRSFFAGFFVADYDGEKVKNGVVYRFLNALLNKFPKPFAAGAVSPSRFSEFMGGSVFVNALGANSGHGFIKWLFHAFPPFGLFALAAGAPFLPTLVLAGLLAAVLVVTLLSRSFIIDHGFIFIVLIILINLICGAASFSRAASIQIAALTSVLMCSYPAVTALVNKRKTADLFFFGFAVSAAATGLVGLYQVVTKKVDMTWVDVELFGQIRFRAYASFGNPNVYGTFLLLAVPLCAALFVYVKKPFYKLCLAGISGLLLLNLMLTYSRGCYLAFALSVLVFVLLTEKRLVVLLSAGLLLLPFVIPQTMLDRLLSITNLADSSTSYRMFIWQGTLRILRDFWLTGVGQGIDAYNAVYPYYAFNAVVAPHSHNLFLQVFVETGIAGLFAFIGFIAWFFRTQARFLRRVSDFRLKAISAAFVAAAVGFLFEGIFDYVFYNYRVMLIFFVFLGLAQAFVRVCEND